MANNFVNSFASIVTAGEFYQSDASDTSTGPQTVYTANNGSSGVNSILIELDAANTGTSGITVSAFIQDTSATLGTVSSIASSSDVATVTTASAPEFCAYVNVVALGTDATLYTPFTKFVDEPVTFTY